MTLHNTPEAFRQRLAQGRVAELRVALYLMSKGCLVRLGFGKAAFDIEFIDLDENRPPGVALRVQRMEVKWDHRATETGNLYFETRNTRQRLPSGIRSTTADWWCHLVGEGHEAFLVPVPSLRTFLDAGSFPSVRTDASDSNSEGLLVPRRKLAGCRSGHWITLPELPPGLR